MLVHVDYMYRVDPNTSRYRTATRTAHKQLTAHSRALKSPKHTQPLALAAVLAGEECKLALHPPHPVVVSVPSCAHAARATHMHSQAPMCSRHTHLPPLYSNTHLTREVDGVQYLPSHPRKARHPTPHSHRGEDEWASWKGRPSQSEARTSEE